VAIPGNMLSATTESVDPNTSGWTAKLNCTISKGTGGRNGDGTLRLSSSAAGEMQARTVASYPVVPGTEYEAFADASGATVPDRIGIQWLTSASAEISITWSVTTATASSTWHRIAVADLAPGHRLGGDPRRCGRHQPLRERLLRLADPHDRQPAGVQHRVA
jgi:hypothetical protein